MESALINIGSNPMNDCLHESLPCFSLKNRAKPLNSNQTTAVEGQGSLFIYKN